MKDNILLSCVCGGFHYVELWADEDFGLQIVHIERPRRLTDKLRCIWKVIRGEDIFDGDLIVKPSDYQKVKTYLQNAPKSNVGAGNDKS